MNHSINSLKKLIVELCPNGVKYRYLGDICTFNKGTPLSYRKAISGSVPVVSGGMSESFYHNISNREKDTITIASSGNAGYVSFWEVPIFCADAFSVDIKIGIKLNKKYLYHYLLNSQEEIYKMCTGVVISHIYGKNLAKLKIPVPPLEVQEEIVNILDKFTKLKDELITLLKVELTDRQKQYEYYRHELFTFKELKI